MNLPQKTIKSKRGQVLIIFLLILIVGLAIVISIASRTLVDIRLSTTSDQSNRAYFAAEAGIEQALRQLNEGVPCPAPPTPCFDLDFDNIRSGSLVTVSTGERSRSYIFPDDIAKDDVGQLALLEDFNNLGSASPVEEFTVYWGNQGVSGPTAPALEVTIVYYQAGLWDLEKFAFDRAGRNNMCSSSVLTASPTTIVDGLNPSYSKNFEYMATVNVQSGVCGWSGRSFPWKPVLARFRMLYNSVPQPVAITVDSSEDELPAQGERITSTGKAEVSPGDPTGVTRKLEAIRTFPALPAIFDYVLFSSSDIVKP